MHSRGNVFTILCRPALTPLDAPLVVSLYAIHCRGCLPPRLDREPSVQYMQRIEQSRLAVMQCVLFSAHFTNYPKRIWASLSKWLISSCRIAMLLQTLIFFRACTLWCCCPDNFKLRALMLINNFCKSGSLLELDGVCMAGSPSQPWGAVNSAQPLCSTLCKTWARSITCSKQNLWAARWHAEHKPGMTLPCGNFMQSASALLHRPCAANC